jgi:hypothetical protein
MYNYFDFDNDRARVRHRFIKEMNKKTTLKDIGEMLDKFILDDKAELSQYYDPEFHMDKTPKSATQDVTN